MADFSNYMKAAGLGGGLSSALGGLFGLFGGGQKNPAQAAMPYLQGIPQQQAQFYNPFVQQGQNAMGLTSGIYNQMAQNPGEYYNQLASGYKESPGYQTRLKEALLAANNAQAAGGMAGSPQHQQLAAQKAVELSSQDFNDYLNQLLGIGKTGLQGEENALTRGYGASGNLADAYGANAAQQAGLAFQGQAGQNQANAGNLENIFKGIGGALPFLWF